MAVTIIADNVIDFERYANVPQDAAYVYSAAHWRDEVKQHFREGQAAQGLKMPWIKTHDTVRFRPGELSIWAGYNGHGKSLLHGQIQLALIAQRQRVCLASLEMPPATTLRRMARQAVAAAFPTEERLDAFFDELAEPFFVYDQRNTIHWQRMTALARYCAAELGIQHIVIDSLMKCGIAPEDYAAQKRFVDELCAVAKDTGLHVHLIAHGRKGATELAFMDKHDIKGASEISDQADNVFTLWRNKRKEEAMQAGESIDPMDPNAILNCSKQRHGEWEGKIRLWFHPRSQQYMEAATSAPRTFEELRSDVR